MQRSGMYVLYRDVNVVRDGLVVPDPKQRQYFATLDRRERYDQDGNPITSTLGAAATLSKQGAFEHALDKPGWAVGELISTADGLRVEE